MGQITIPGAPGIQVRPIDRQSGPAAGAGASGNNSLFLGSNAGLNSAVSNLIVLGSGAGAGGMVGAGLAGSTVVGVGSVAALTGVTFQAPAFNSANTVLGSNNVPGIVTMDTSLVVGAGNLPVYVGANRNLTQSIILGNANWPLVAATANIANVIIIGQNNFKAVTDASQTVSLVMIGNGNGSAGVATNISNSQVIGNNIAFLGPSGTGCTLIGDSLSQPNNVGQNIIIGQLAASTSSTAGLNVMIGAATAATGELNTVLGYKATTNGTSSGCVVIGANASTNATNALLIASSTAIGGGAGNGASALVFGSFLNGNLLLGTSLQGTNRDFGGVPGTNMLKLLNGTAATGANVIGGGYFYVTGGFLHWVDSNGTDSQLSATAVGQLASSALVAYANNAAAQAGTLTNAPVAGNPTKWIPINDNGTIRNIPAW